MNSLSLEPKRRGQNPNVTVSELPQGTSSVPAQVSAAHMTHAGTLHPQQSPGDQPVATALREEERKCMAHQKRRQRTLRTGCATVPV